MRVQQCVCFARYARSLSTRKWFPLQGELAPLTKNVVLSLIIIDQYCSFHAGCWHSSGNVCWRSWIRRRRRRGYYYRLLLLLLLLVLLPLRLESLPFLSSSIAFAKHSCENGYYKQTYVICAWVLETDARIYNILYIYLEIP